MAGGGSSEVRAVEREIRELWTQLNSALISSGGLAGRVADLGGRVRELERVVAGLQDACRLSPAVVLGPSAAGVRSAARAATDGGAVGVVVGATVPPRKRVK